MRQLDVSFLEMPYEGENGTISMFIFLPVFMPIDDILAKLTPEMLDEVFKEKKLWNGLKYNSRKFRSKTNLILSR